MHEACAPIGSRAKNKKERTGTTKQTRKMPARPSLGAHSLAHLSHPRTHPPYPSRSRRAAKASTRGACKPALASGAGGRREAGPSPRPQWCGPRTGGGASVSPASPSAGAGAQVGMGRGGGTGAHMGAAAGGGAKAGAQGGGRVLGCGGGPRAGWASAGAHMGGGRR